MENINGLLSYEMVEVGNDKPSWETNLMYLKPSLKVTFGSK